MEKELDYTTIRVEREVKFDIERITAWLYKTTGEKMNAGDVVKHMTKFFIDTTIGEKEPEQS